MPRLYKDEFFLALYDLRDNILGTFSNCNELAIKTGCSPRKIRKEVRRCSNSESTINFLGIRARIYLIPDKEEEEMKYVRN